MEITKSNDKNTIYRLTMVIIIIIQALFLLFLFSFAKKGYHSDEVYNYGFANSYYQKELYVTNDGVALSNKWLDGSRLKDYITVDKDHRFSFDSVYNNSKRDFNPPLQICILHFISSLFPGTFSWYFGFVINIVAFIISQVYLALYVNNITKSRIASIASLILYGFCAGAMDVTFFLRIYALGVMFIVIFAYYSHLIYDNRKNNKNLLRNLILSFVFLFLGGQTMYIFYVVAFPIVLSYCLYYLFSKRIKLFFAYGFICLGATSLSIAAFPYLFSSTAGPSESYSYSLAKFPFKMQLRLYISKLTKDLFGIHISSMPNPYLEYFLIFIVCAIVIITPFAIVFRKEEWFDKIVSWFKKKFKLLVSNFLNRFQFTLVVLIVSTVFLWIIVSFKTSYYIMNIYANRYLFAVYPLASVFVVSLIFFVLKFFVVNKKVIGAILIPLCIILTIWSHFVFGSHDYFFVEEKEGIGLEEIEDNSNCIFVLDSVMFASIFAPKLYDKVDSYYLTDFNTYKGIDFYKDIDHSKPIYLIYNNLYIIPDEDADVLETENFKMLYGKVENMFAVESDFYSNFKTDEVEKIEVLGKESLMGRHYSICKIEFRK